MDNQKKSKRKRGLWTQKKRQGETHSCESHVPPAPGVYEPTAKL